MSSKSVLLVGETGCGKTSFINTITNSFKNGSLDDLKVTIPTQSLQSTEGYAHSEHDTQDLSTSQTEQCTTYSFQQDNVTYNFIDTPGLNDTRSTQKDAENMAKILDTAKATPDLAAVLLIINGTQSRLTPAMESVLVTLKGNVPTSVMQNLIVVLSKCDKRRATFQLSTLAIIAPDIQKKSIFYMDNTAFVPNAQKSWTEPACKSEWDESMKTCKRIAQLVGELDYVPVHEFNEVVQYRDRIKGCMQDAKLEMTKYQGVIEQLEIARERDCDLVKDEAKFKNYIRHEVKMVPVKKVTPHFHTLCGKCEQTCHQQCDCEGPEKVSLFERFCDIFDDADQCSHCSGKCHHMDHYRAKYIFAQEEQTVETILYDMKREYEYIVDERAEVKMQIDSYNNAIAALDQTMQAIMDRLDRDCNELKQLCTGFNFADELRVMYNQLTLEAKKQRTIEARNAISTSLAVLQEMINFHSAETGSMKNASLLRPDLDEYHEFSLDTDSDEEFMDPIEAGPDVGRDSHVRCQWQDIDECQEKSVCCHSLGYAGTVEQSESTQRCGTANTVTRIRVQNLPASWNKAKLDKFFSQFGTITSSVVACDPATKESRGLGFVNFLTHDEAMEAIEGAMNHVVGEGEAAKKLYARLASMKTQSDAQKARPARQQRWAGCNLYLKSLPENMTDERLRDIFSTFGTITSVKIMTNTDGVNTGIGYVCFSTPEEAAKAMGQMNSALIDGKPIHAALHQSTEVTQKMKQPMQHTARFGGSVQRGSKKRPNKCSVCGCSPTTTASPRRACGSSSAKPTSQSLTSEDFVTCSSEMQVQILAQMLHPSSLLALKDNLKKYLSDIHILPEPSDLIDDWSHAPSASDVVEFDLR